MHDLNQYLVNKLAERLKNRLIVTWYDPRREFSAFIAELAGGAVPEKCQLDLVEVSGQQTSLCVMQKSFFEVKFAAEAIAETDQPSQLVIYIPGKDRHDNSAILMELELGGDRWEPSLKREARRVLKNRFGDGQIDQMLSSPNITYEDIVGLLEDGGNAPATGSLLEVIFTEAKGSNAAVLAAWLAGTDRDAQIIDKGAKQELFQLIQSRLGLELASDAELEDARKKVCRYVLLGEFRKDLKGDPPESLNMVSQPATKQLELVLEVAKSIREFHADKYVKLADDIQQELHLESLGIAPENLGAIDTFRFEEQSLLEHVGGLIVSGGFAEAHDVVRNRRYSFWARHQLDRQEQWQAYGLSAQLGMAVAEVTKQLPDAKKTVVNWTEGYVAKDGWYRIDQLHRRLESTLAAMTDSIASEKVIHRVRKDYESLVDRMTTGFVSAFKESGWSIPGVLQQTEIYNEEVHSPSETTCFILADALRYEMGVELMGLLENAEQLSIRPAVGVIPTITPVGMAALMPGAEESFSVVECGKDIGAKINASVTGSLNDRRKVWKGKVPDVVDLSLDKVLSHSSSQLQKKIKDAPLLIVRSVEIDAMGEGGNTFLARQVMDTAINNVARAIKRLASMGISRFVVAADHGHLFIHERDESERIEKPGGEQVSLHRRCWAGRGGSTPPSTIRISASELGYDSDLDFVFPTNNSVFKAGGDLAYYHGGLSLQELLVPVLSIRMPAKAESEAPDINIALVKVPEKIANRIVTFGLRAEKTMFSEDSFSVRPVLLYNGQHVGHVGMVLDAEHEVSTQSVRMESGTSCTVGVQLLRDDIDNVEIVVLDPETDRMLAKSNKILVKLGI
tara:strand:- start:284 stop:2830 length:2547 start_codon:yes stop_codon:yes gene_type:complete